MQQRILNTILFSSLQISCIYISIGQVNAQVASTFEPTRFSVNVKAYYPLTYFTLNTVPTSFASLGLEYDLSKYFVAQFDYNFGYLISDNDKVTSTHIKDIRSFTNDFKLTTLKIGLNLEEFFGGRKRFNFKFLAGGGQWDCRVNAISYGNEFKGFNKQFFVVSAAAELAYKLNKYWKVTVSAEYINSQTYYMDNQVSEHYDQLALVGVGVKYSIHKREFICTINLPELNENYIESNVQSNETAVIPNTTNNLENNSNHKINAIIHQLDSIKILLNGTKRTDEVYNQSDSLLHTPDTLLVDRLPIKAGEKYNVIVGTFSVYEVQKGVRMVKESKDELFLLSGRKNTTMVRVAILSTSSFKEAQRIMEFCRNRIGYKDAWIYQK
jgi:hypothetical protein